MPPAYVAVDIATPAPDQHEIALAIPADPHALPGLETAQQRAVVFLIGHDSAAVRARGHAEPAVEFVGADDLGAVAQGILERTDLCAWVVFDLDDLLARWEETDETGVLASVRRFDAGELAALAMPQVSVRSLEAMLAAARAADGGEHPPLPELLPRGLRTAEALAELWERLPGLIGRRPYALRNAIKDLLQRATDPLAEVWAEAAQGPPAEGEPELLSSLLRSHWEDLTPPPPDWEEPPPPKSIDVDAVRGVFANGGPLAALMPGYEQRDGQVQMAVGVAETLNGGECLLVEAGTGTGKSLAYLAPAVLYAVENQTPVVVSTNTKNLQDQLFSKDLPLLRAALGREFRAELIKGRANYLCIDKLLAEYGDAGLVFDETRLFFLAYLLSWAAESRSGDLDELSAYLVGRYPHLERFARRLASDPESCTATTARSHPCFATTARRRAWQTDVLVVNHALALANSNFEVLPPFRHVLFDEAHNLEDIATDAFGLSVDRRVLLGLLRDTGSTRDARSATGRIRRELGDLPAEFSETVLALVADVEALAADTGAQVDEFGQRWADVVTSRLRRRVDDLTLGDRMRLNPTIYDDATGEALKASGQNLHERMEALAKLWTQVSNALAGLRTLGSAGDVIDRLSTAAQAARNEWSEQAKVLEEFLSLEDERFVYWLEYVLRRDDWEWKLRAAPIEAGDALAANVYAKMDAVVLTSATLSVNGKFDYFGRRLGLTSPLVGDRYRQLAVPSSFDYPEQVLLALPMTIASPRDERFERHTLRAVEDIVTLLDGRTLVLFTSLRAMRDAHDALAGRFRELGIEPLCQGVSGSRHVIAERFRRNERSVLFGTRSFWEGIDLPGDTLQCVVIVKLPFAVPDDPVVAARCEHLEKQGLDPWACYSIPSAVILFKQGFGRLIRTARDRGVVLVLDRRLKEKSYGRAFLQSVPGYTGVFDTWAEIRRQVRRWVHERRSVGVGGQEPAVGGE